MVLRYLHLPDHFVIRGGDLLRSDQPCALYKILRSLSPPALLLLLLDHPRYAQQHSLARLSHRGRRRLTLAVGELYASYVPLHDGHRADLAHD